MKQRFFTGRMQILILLCYLCLGLGTIPTSVLAESSNGQMTEEKALMLAEQFEDLLQRLVLRRQRITLEAPAQVRL